MFVLLVLKVGSADKGNINIAIFKWLEKPDVISANFTKDQDFSLENYQWNFTSYRFGSLKRVDSKCQICGLEGQLTNHVLFTCSLARQLWIISQYPYPHMKVSMVSVCKHAYFFF